METAPNAPMNYTQHWILKHWYMIHEDYDCIISISSYYFRAFWIFCRTLNIRFIIDIWFWTVCPCVCVLFNVTYIFVFITHLTLLLVLFFRCWNVCEPSSLFMLIHFKFLFWFSFIRRLRFLLNSFFHFQSQHFKCSGILVRFDIFKWTFVLVFFFFIHLIIYLWHLWLHSPLSFPHSFRNQNLILICLRMSLCVCVYVYIVRRFCLFLQILDKVNVPTTYLHITEPPECREKFFLFTIAFGNEFFLLFDSSFCFPLFLSSAFAL